MVAASSSLAGSPITFSATGTVPVQTPATLTMVSGNNQTGTPGQPLSSPFTVSVTDTKGNPVSGVTVTFTVTAGGGTLSASSVATNSAGVASSTLTLGVYRGRQLGSCGIRCAGRKSHDIQLPQGLAGTSGPATVTWAEQSSYGRLARLQWVSCDSLRPGIAENHRV